MAFLFPIFMTAGFARTTNNRGKEIIPPGLAKKNLISQEELQKIFDDIDGIQWAKEAIELMQLKAYSRIRGRKIC